ncbi:MAG: hypothetical protein AAF226_08575 [Verrucomicrobiota bacterium]
MLDTIITWADHRDTDYRKPYQGKFANKWKYLFRPARASYAPVNLGTTCLLSVIATNYDAASQTAEIAIGIDPIFYLWNPYNREVEVDNLAVYFETGMPGTVTLTIESAGGNEKTYDIDLWRLLFDNFDNYHKNSHARYWGKSYSFLINGSNMNSDPIVLAPGEVLAASPSSESGQSYLGYDDIGNTSGIIMTSLRGVPSRVSVAPGATKINIGYHRHAASGFNSPRFFMDTNIAPPGTTAPQLAENRDILGDQLQSTHMQLTARRNEYVAGKPKVFNFNQDLNGFLNRKHHFGLFAYLMKPASWSGQRPNPAEVFSRFNPAPMVINKDWWAAAAPNMIYHFVADQNPNNLLNNNGINFSSSDRRAFWGKSYDSSASTTVPLSNIPNSPLLSLADFAHANVATMAEEPFHAIGNSWASPVISPVAPYGTVNTGGGVQTYGTGFDTSWHCNDMLFDRYYLSGIAPEFDIDETGYQKTGTIEDSLTRFFGQDLTADKSSPLITPYLPEHKTVSEVISELTPSVANHDSYKKLAGYSMIKGPFNVNSTSLSAWTSLLRANRDLLVKQADGSTNEEEGTPFPSSSTPSSDDEGNNPLWSGFARLTDEQIVDLATEIVEEVKSRGPFMSISDFVNRKVGGADPADIKLHGGALQKAIDESEINRTALDSAGGVNSNYRALSPIIKPTTKNGSTTNGIPGSVTQADILRPLAPRLTARSDTFRIRAYGEVRSTDESNIISKAICEAVVQRFPDYMDTEEDPTNNQPWSDVTSLNQINKTLGRKFKIVQFRWLSPDEIDG